MDIYHIWCDLRPGASDVEFADACSTYLSTLRDRGEAAGFRITRRKLGLGAPGLGELHIMIEFTSLAQLDEAFNSVSSRAEPIESFHFAVNRHVTNVTFALYRDFPDPNRKIGEEKF